MPPYVIETIEINEVIAMLKALPTQKFHSTGDRPILVEAENGNFILSEHVKELIDKLRMRLINDQNEDDWA